MCTEQIPSDRLLILRTHELGRSHERLARFLQIAPETLEVRQEHVNRSSWGDRIETLVDRAYMEETVRSICKENLARYFPEVTGMDSAGRLWL